MNPMDKKDAEIRPDLVRRTGGGWLAVAPKWAILSIGVTAPTQEEALEKFCSVYKRWIELLNTKVLDVPKEAS